MTHRGRSFEVDTASIALTAVPVLTAFAAHLSGATSPASMVTLCVIAFVTTSLELLRLHSRLGKGSGPGALVFQAGVLFWFYVPALITAFSTRQWHQSAAHVSIDNASAVEALLLIALFHYAFVLANQWRPSVSWQASGARFLTRTPRLNLRASVLLLLAATCLGIGFYALESGGLIPALRFALLSRSEIKPWSSEGNYGTEVTPFHFAAQGLLVASSVVGLTLVLLRKVSGLRRGLLLISSLFAVAFVSLDSGTRSTLLMASLPPLIVYYSQTRANAGGRRQQNGFFRYAAVATILLAVVAGANFQLQYRSRGELAEPVRLQVDDNDFFTSTAFALEVQRLTGEYTRDSIVLALATGVVPRVLWEGKPDSRTVIVFSAYIRGQDVRVVGGSVVPSVVGQQYMSGGLRVVIQTALVLGLLLALGDLAFARATLTGKMVYAGLVSYIFVSFRFFTFGFFSSVLVLLAANLVATRARSRGGRRAESIAIDNLAAARGA